MINIVHNKSIKSFDDIVYHLRLEDKQLEATKINHQAYLVENSKYTHNFKKRKGFHDKKFKGG